VNPASYQVNDVKIIMLEAILSPSRLTRSLRRVRLSIGHPRLLLHHSVSLIRISHSLCHQLLIPLLLCPIHDGADTAPFLTRSVIDL
jgi:hypothetical protein